MASGDDARFAFLVEWFDPQMGLVKHYNLLIWPESSMIEMVQSYNDVIPNAHLAHCHLHPLFVYCPRAV